MYPNTSLISIMYLEPNRAYKNKAPIFFHDLSYTMHPTNLPIVIDLDFLEFPWSWIYHTDKLEVTTVYAC